MGVMEVAKARNLGQKGGHDVGMTNPGHVQS